MAKQAVFNPPLRLKQRYRETDAWAIAVDDWDWLIFEPSESREPRWQSIMGYDVVVPEEAVVADH